MDGRVAVRVWKDRNITVSMGPSPEGKTHHVTLANDLNGQIIGTTDTYDGRPCPPGAGPAAQVPSQRTSVEQATWVTRQAPRADGAIVHVVQPGDTLWAIANAYGLPDIQAILALNDLTSGYWLFPGQEIRIPTAATTPQE